MVSAIVVAAGSGRRMGREAPKQFIDLKGIPIVVHSLRALEASPSIDQMILVLREEDLIFARDEILPALEFSAKIRLVSGGATRQASVFNGIQAIESQSCIVVVHDGVRPFTRPQHIEACIAHAKAYGACVLGVPVTDTLKRVDSHKVITGTLDRVSIWHAQTPQAFRYELILRAHERAIQEGYVASDDALLVEKLGEHVGVIRGSKYNVKITTEEDLILAEAIFSTGNY